jgi:ATP-dependent helicase/nuclease subunit B
MFDGGAWPGPLTDRDAVMGESWLGELGFVGLLETMLGLSGPATTTGERAAALVAGLRQGEGFWSESAENDPLGSARELLRWRDELAFGGWRGEGKDLPGRIAGLAQLEEFGLPGTPDRLRAILDTIPRRTIEIAQLDLFEARVDLPPLWRQVIEALESRGTVVFDRELLVSPAAGDLEASRSGHFELQGDGSLQLIRSDGPWAAAVEVAAWLSTREQNTDRGTETLVISPSPLLDTELRRFGLPTTGARETRGGSSLLEVLPLVLSLCWDPVDPQDALSLLSLPQSPVPRGVTRRLRRALGQWPAVGSGEWRRALADGLAAIDDEEYRTRVKERLHRIFERGVPRASSGVPKADLLSRTSLVAQWIRGRRFALENARSDGIDGKRAELGRGLDEAASFCASFSRVVELAGLDHWHPADIQRFLEEARAGITAEIVLPAEAGLAMVSDPAAVVGPARCVVWWNFTRDSVQRPVGIPLSRAERDALADTGVVLESPADAALRLSARWQRPLFQTSEALLLVAPRTNEAGKESHPHPLWDEIASRASDSEGISAEEFVGGEPYATPRATLVDVPTRSLVSSRRVWKVRPDQLPLPERASQSLIGDVLRCPFKWAVGRVGGIRAPDQVDVGATPRALGILSHALLEEVLPKAQGDTDAAREFASEWFDAEAPIRLASLFLPGQEAELARDRRIMVEAAGTFATFLKDSDLELQQTEVEIEGQGLGRKIFGIPDLVLGPRPVIVDAKWGGLTYRRDALAKGTASQLAFYTHILAQQDGYKKAAMAAVGYFVLSEARLVTTDAGLGGSAEHQDGADPAETWLALDKAFDARKAEFASGQVLATALSEDTPIARSLKESKDGVHDNGALALVPECKFCDLDGLCGKAFAEAIR